LDDFKTFIYSLQTTNKVVAEIEVILQIIHFQ